MHSEKLKEKHFKREKYKLRGQASMNQAQKDSHFDTLNSSYNHKMHNLLLYPIVIMTP